MSPERLAARRLVDQAKAQLIADHAMTEPDAYRWIQKTAMDRRTTMARIAAGIIDGSDHPEPPVPARSSQPVGATG